MRKSKRARLTDFDHYQEERENPVCKGSYFGVGHKSKVGSFRLKDEEIVPVDSYCRRPFGAHEIEDED